MSEPSRSADETMLPADEFARSNSMDSWVVIKMITEGAYVGKKIDDVWFIAKDSEPLSRSPVEHTRSQGSTNTPIITNNLISHVAGTIVGLIVLALALIEFDQDQFRSPVDAVMISVLASVVAYLGFRGILFLVRPNR